MDHASSGALCVRFAAVVMCSLLPGGVMCWIARVPKGIARLRRGVAISLGLMSLKRTDVITVT
jgi:hypothetical protein